MITKVTHVTILVKDQDEALVYYTNVLGFEKLHDETIQNGFRWLVVAPVQQHDIGLVLLKATPETLDTVGKQTGNISSFVVTTDDCRKTYEEFKAKGVTFLGEPVDNPWGLDVQFVDLYGNKFDLVEQKEWDIN